MGPMDPFGPLSPAVPFSPFLPGGPRCRGDRADQHLPFVHCIPEDPVVHQLRLIPGVQVRQHSRGVLWVPGVLVFHGHRLAVPEDRADQAYLSLQHVLAHPSVRDYRADH